MNIFGDIHGCYYTFLALIKKMPQGPIVSLGDMIDYGPYSREVLEFFMSGKGMAIKGNHELYMTESFRIVSDNRKSKIDYTPEFWLFANKGESTVKSFGMDIQFPPVYFKKEVYKLIKDDLTQFLNTPEIKYSIEQIKKIPLQYIEYCENLPVSIKFGNTMIGHAPISRIDFPQTIDPNRFLEKQYLFNTSILKNTRNLSRPLKGIDLYIYGHMNDDQVRWHTNRYPHGIYSVQCPEGEIPFAICMDTIKEGFLSAIHLPTMTVYQQAIVEEDKDGFIFT